MVPTAAPCKISCRALNKRCGSTACSCGVNELSCISVIPALYRDNGKENENYYIIVGYILGLYRDHERENGTTIHTGSGCHSLYLPFSASKAACSPTIHKNAREQAQKHAHLHLRMRPTTPSVHVHSNSMCWCTLSVVIWFLHRPK